MDTDKLIQLQIIDDYISQISKAHLVQSSDVVDFLLDLRLTMATAKELV